MALDNLARFERDDLIDALQPGRSMRQKQHSSSRQTLQNAIENFSCGFGIETFGRLVEHEDGGFGPRSAPWTTKIRNTTASGKVIAKIAAVHDAGPACARSPNG